MVTPNPAVGASKCSQLRQASRPSRGQSETRRPSQMLRPIRPVTPSVLLSFLTPNPDGHRCSETRRSRPGKSSAREVVERGLDADRRARRAAGVVAKVADARAQRAAERDLPRIAKARIRFTGPSSRRPRRRRAPEARWWLAAGTSGAAVGAGAGTVVIAGSGATAVAPAADAAGGSSASGSSATAARRTRLRPRPSGATVQGCASWIAAATNPAPRRR